MNNLGASLARLQNQILLALFLLGTTLTSTSAWVIIGVGMRAAEDAGVHRKSSKRAKADPFEYEMGKRAFWAIYFLDRYISSLLDRPLALREEEYVSLFFAQRLCHGQSNSNC
jgi:Fungal specific transcription factor domain